MMIQLDLPINCAESGQGCDTICEGEVGGLGAAGLYHIISDDFVYFCFFIFFQNPLSCV